LKKKKLYCVFFLCVVFVIFKSNNVKICVEFEIVCQSIIEKKKLIIEKEFRNGVTHANKYIVEFFIQLKSIFNFID